MKVMTMADRKALELLSLAYQEYREASDVIAREGATYETTTENGNTMIRPRPEVRLRAESWRRTSTMLQEFGLTPAARSRVYGVDGSPNRATASSRLRAEAQSWNDDEEPLFDRTGNRI